MLFQAPNAPECFSVGALPGPHWESLRRSYRQTPSRLGEQYPPPFHFPFLWRLCLGAFAASIDFFSTNYALVTPALIQPRIDNRLSDARVW